MQTAILSQFDADGLYLCTAWREDLFKVKDGRYSAEIFRIVCKLPYFPSVDGRPGNVSFRDSLANRFFHTAIMLPADHDSQLSNDDAKWCIVTREGMARSLRLVDWAGARTRPEYFEDSKAGVS